MARIDKKFINKCIEKYPEVKKHKELFGLELSDISKVLKDDYSYTPADPNPLVTEDTNLMVNIDIGDKKFNSISGNLKYIEECVKSEMIKEYGIFNYSEVKNIEIYAQEDTMVCSFTRSRTETKAELAARMVQDYEDKSLFLISTVLKNEYDDLINSEIRAKEEKERRRLQAEIAVLEKRKKELEKQINK